MTRSPTSADAAGGRALEVVEQAGLAALAALLVLEREVVQAASGRLVVVELEARRLAGRPGVGRGGVRILAERDRLLGRDPGGFEEVLGRGRLFGVPGGFPGCLGEGREDVGRVVQLDELGRRSR